MNQSSLFKAMAKLMVSITLAAPLQGCLVTTGNVNLGDSFSSAMNGLVKTTNGLLSGGTGHKEWPFIPTRSEIDQSKFSDAVMRQAIAQKSVSIGFSASEKTDLKNTHADFNAFMENAPNMDQWTVAQVSEYVNYLGKMTKMIDPVLAASEKSGSSSANEFSSKIKRNNGVIKVNEVYVPAHSLVQVGVATHCADEGLPPPTSAEIPNLRIVPAAFASVVPVDLANHMRNIQNSFASGQSGQPDYMEGRLIWSLTQADVFTSSSSAIFQAKNQSRLDQISPGLYADYNAVNNRMATAGGQVPKANINAYPINREVLKPALKYSYASPSSTAQARAENTSSSLFKPNVYYSVRNEYFVSKIAIFNAGNEDFRVDLSKYSLVSDGTAFQQRLVFSGYAGQGMKNAIGDNKSVSVDVDSLTLARMVAMDITRFSISKGAEKLRDLGKNPAFLASQSSLIKQFGSDVLKKFFRQAPLVSGLIAANEAYTGVDFVSGRSMTGIERGLAALEATPTPGATAEKLALKLNWSRIASAISTYGDTVRGSIYWDAAGFGLESYKQTLGSTGDYLSGQWSNSQLQNEGQQALIFINNSGAAIDKFVASYALKG